MIAAAPQPSPNSTPASSANTVSGTNSEVQTTIAAMNTT